MNKLKQEKGSVTVFVLTAMLFFIIILMGIYVSSANSKKNQQNINEDSRKSYEEEVEYVDEVYNELYDKMETPINAYIKWNNEKISLAITNITGAEIIIKDNDADLSKCKYIVTENSEKIGTDSEYWNSATAYSLTSKINKINNMSIVNENDYYIHVLTVNNHDKKTETVSKVMKAINYSFSNTYEYTGKVQKVVIPETGYYNVEVYGASGGTSVAYNGEGTIRYGGKGGASKGKILLNKNTELYIYIGGAGGEYSQDATSDIGRMEWWWKYLDRTKCLWSTRWWCNRHKNKRSY